jgi:hypothetical protein
MTKLQFVLGASFSLILFSSAGAQTPGPPAGGSDRNLRDSASDLKIRSNEMERLKRDAEKPESRTNPTPNFTEIKEDFERIQIVNGEVQENATSATPNYERLSKGLEEIHTRATRLKGNLFPPQSDKKPKEDKKVDAQAELKSLFIALDNSIVRFSQSPIFQNVKLVNSDDSKKAQEELEKVIKLSSVIAVETNRIKTTSSP